MLDSLGLVASGGCLCDDRAAAMDTWGVEGCLERREEILTWLRGEYNRLGWRRKLLVGMWAVGTGLAFRVNAPDPAASLFDEAIRRATAGR
ncbi:MAG TPA: hypothetical protein VFG68_23875 [Fimbriiglobus sp.]|nr:hypothetical protein [Fimbriiglobus sp.]